jgi:hypothetical protein
VHVRFNKRKFVQERRMQLIKKTNEHVRRLKSRLTGIDYQLVFGGAVRDSLMERSYQDVDLFFTDRTKYINTVGRLCEEGYSIVELCRRKWSKNFICLFGRYEKENRFNKSGKEFVDVMLFDCTEEELIADFKLSFDFGVNVCYMKDGEIYASDRCLSEIENGGVLELVSDKISIGNCIVRAEKFRSRGFKVGSSVIGYIIKEIELMEDSPEDYESSRYIKVHGGYGTYCNIKGKKLYRDFFKLIDEDTLILAMMSSSEKILDYSKNNHNKKINKKGVVSKIRNLFA